MTASCALVEAVTRKLFLSICDQMLFKRVAMLRANRARKPPHWVNLTSVNQAPCINYGRFVLSASADFARKTFFVGKESTAKYFIMKAAKSSQLFLVMRSTVPLYE